MRGLRGFWLMVVPSAVLTCTLAGVAHGQPAGAAPSPVSGTRASRAPDLAAPPEPGAATSPVLGPAASRAPDPLPVSRAPDILLSRQLLEAQGLSVGEIVTLSRAPSGAGAVPFRIAGSYEPVADPMRLSARRWEARLHLPDLLALTADPSDPQAAESVTAIHVALKDPADAVAFAADVRARLPSLDAAPARRPPGEAGPFVVLERFHFAIALITVLGSTAFLMALMVMRVEERREMAGILRLIGLSRRRILLEVLLEGLLVAACGSVFGVVFAAATQGAANRYFQWRYDTVLVFVRVTAPIALRCVALAVPLGALAGLVASWTLLRRDISALFRR